MPDLLTLLPYRLPELVSRPLGENGSYLVRNRNEGESFHLGPQEHFLLSRLDGTRTAEDLRAAFAQRFGEPLAAEELEDFLHLARERGLLQGDETGTTRPRGAGPVKDWRELAGRISHRSGHAEQSKRHGTAVQRIVARVLDTVAAMVQWVGSLLNRAAGRIQLLKLMHIDFVPRSDDIFLVTYPRSGTTWMQMILYQLTTDGDMDFPHIYEYCPWFENSSRCADGFEGRPSPRLFKSHLPYRQVPKGPGKYIYVARDGKDVAVSYFHFYRSHLGFRGTFDEFFELFVRGKVEGGSWFEHVKGWWRRRHDPNVLFLRYEELLGDLESCLRRIISFCKLEVEPARFPTILERCSFAFMKAHESQFDYQIGALWEQGVQGNAFLRQGRSGEGREKFSPHQAERFETVYRDELGPAKIEFRARQDYQINFVRGK